MIKHLVAPLIFTSLILTGCQSPQGKFTPEQVAAMQSYGFTESAGDWSLGLSDAILFAKNDYKLLPESQQQICNPVWSDVVCNPCSKILISMKKETSLGDTVCLVVKFLRHHLIEIF